MQHDQNCSGYLPQAIVFNNCVNYKLLRFQCAKKNQIQGKNYSHIRVIHKVKKWALKPPIWSHNG